MSINLATFETALQAKLNGLDSTNDVEDFVLLTKSVEDIDIAKTTSYASVGDLPDAGDHEGRIVYVSGTDKVYYSDGVSWVTFATSQNPDFTTAYFNDDSIGSTNYALITDGVTTTEDYGAISGAVTQTNDFGFGLTALSAGTQGDIYIDPNDWTFTIYDGDTRGGIRHLRADKNNINFRTMSAANQGVAHVVKNTDTTTVNGGLEAIPFDELRLNDTRMGYLDSDGYYFVNYDGWYEVTLDGHVDKACWLGFGSVTTYSTEEGQAYQGPDEYTMQYVFEEGNFNMKRMVYIPVSGNLVLFAAGSDPNVQTTIRGTSNWVSGNVNASFKYLTQMTIKFLGDNTGTNSYQISAS
jgi:hypothetical protein